MKSENVKEVMKNTGWNKKEVNADFEKAKSLYHFKEKEYVKNKVYQLNDEERELLRQRLYRKKVQKDLIILEITKVLGCTEKEASERLRAARKLYGIKKRDYVKYELYRIPESEFAEKYQQVIDTYLENRAVRKADRVETRKAGNAACRKMIMEKTGWDKATLKEKYQADHEKYGCNYEQFYQYNFDSISEEDKEQYFLGLVSKQLRQKYDVTSYFATLMANKIRTNVVYSDYIKRPWCANRNITFEQFEATFRGTEKIFYKPLQGHHGDGAEAIKLKDADLHEVYEHIISLSPGIVEGFILQHSKMKELHPNVINSVRVVSLSSFAKPIEATGNNIEILYVSVKMGGKTGCVDNLIGGGMVAAADVSTGKLVTNSIDDFLNVYEDHPVTGTKIKGFEIPYFKEALKMVYDASEKLKMEGYFGWDIAITEDGPEMVEVNTCPGTILIQLPYMPENKGVKYMIEKYL